MPRNSGGAYSLPAGQPVVTGTTISTSTFNALTSDLASELTDSLDRSGKGAMLAQFVAVDGTETAPGVAFSNDHSTGIYGAAGAVIITAGGDLATFTQGGATLAGPLTVTTQTVTPVAQSLGSNWTGTVTRWIDTVSKELKMHGSAVAGAAANDVIATLPVGSRPSVLISLLIPKSNSGIYSVGAVTIDTDGTITQQTGKASGTVYWFDQVRFLHA